MNLIIQYLPDEWSKNVAAATDTPLTVKQEFDSVLAAVAAVPGITAQQINAAADAISKDVVDLTEDVKALRDQVTSLGSSVLALTSQVSTLTSLTQQLSTITAQQGANVAAVQEEIKKVEAQLGFEQPAPAPAPPVPLVASSATIQVSEGLQAVGTLVALANQEAV